MNTGERQTNIWDDDQHELENKQTTMNIERKQRTTLVKFNTKIQTHIIEDSMETSADIKEEIYGRKKRNFLQSNSSYFCFFYKMLYLSGLTY